MAAVTQIVVQEYSVHPSTGRIELAVVAKTTDGSQSWTGPAKRYSVDPQALRDRWNNDLDQWEAWVGKQHQSVVGHPADLPEQLAARKGKVIA